MPQTELEQQMLQRQQPKSPGIFQRIKDYFSEAEMTPEVREAIKIAKQENPDLGEVRMYGPVSRALVGDNAQAYVNAGLGDTIYLNPKYQGNDVQEIVNTLTHEQEHVRQSRKSNFWKELLKAYTRSDEHGLRPEEQEAFQAEKARRGRLGQPQPVYPSAMGGFYQPYDIKLPSRKRVVAQQISGKVDPIR